jgi:hypothetical protein|tara:strand:+ start:430 stop:642 length:213 start_codon:yes stop_codon:yes gene_type:complete
MEKVEGNKGAFGGYESNVTVIKCLQGSFGNFYVVGLATGVVNIYDCTNGNCLVELQAHSRIINSIACHMS